MDGSDKMEKWTDYVEGGEVILISELYASR